MKKIGVVSCYKNDNYGSVLQAFAMQEKIRIWQIPFEYINYSPKFSLASIFRKLHLIFIKSAIKMKLENLKRNLFMKYLAKKHKRHLFAQRKNAFASFRNDRFFTSEPINSLRDLHKKSNEYSKILCGSDQLWHPINLGTRFFDLSWVDERIPKISYATSFGVSKIPFIQIKQMRDCLNKFSNISVREESGKKIVKKMTGKECQISLDPTLLFNSNEWDYMLNLNKKERITNKPYIFCYFLGKNIEHRKFAKQLGEETGFEIYTIPHIDDFVPADEKFTQNLLYNIDPSDFVSLIKNSNYICTDSYHGTIFSILYKKQFFSFARYSHNSSASANNRLLNLFSMLDIESSLNNDKLLNFNSNIDYAKIHAKLNYIRNDSENYFYDILKGKPYTVTGE